MKKNFIIYMMTILSVGAIEINAGPTRSPSASKVAITKALIANPISSVSSNTVDSNVTSAIFNSNTANTGSVGDYSARANSDNRISMGTINAAGGAATAMSIDTTGKQLTQTGIQNTDIAIVGADAVNLTANTVGNPLPVSMTASQVASNPVAPIPSMAGLTLTEAITNNRVKNLSKTTTSANTSSAVDATTAISARNSIIGAGSGGATILGNTQILNTGSGEFNVDVTGSAGSTLTSFANMPTSLATLTQPAAPTPTPAPAETPMTTVTTIVGGTTTSTTSPTVSSFSNPTIATNMLKNKAKTSTKVLTSQDTSSVLNASSNTDAGNFIESDGLGITGITDSANVETLGATSATVKLTGAKNSNSSSVIQAAGSSFPTTPAPDNHYIS